MQNKPDPRILPLAPRPGALMKTIRTIAKTSERVFFGTHARSRMMKREISDADTIRVLILGEIRGAITPGDNAGEWVCKVVAKLKGSREIGVVTITLSNTKVFVKTVEWEDW